MFLLDSSQRLVWRATIEDFLDLELTNPAVLSVHLAQGNDQMQAPVLIIPQVLSHDLCDALVQKWHTGGHSVASVLRLGPSGPTSVVDSETKRRRDHLLEDDRLTQKVLRHIRTRVAPQLSHAFHFVPGRCESCKVVCYSAEDRGYFRAHRDDRNPASRERRFSMSINLTRRDYVGGELRFPEYGERRYCIDKGSALIFSSSLLHEVIPVSTGRRFALITFFYGS